MKHLLPIIAILTGCGSTTDRQAHSVKVETLVIPAITVESPAGTFSTTPVTIRRKVEEVAEETKKKTVDLPDAGAVLQPLLAGSPWGGIITGVLGLGAAALTAKKAVDNARQRDNVIDSMEAAKRNMDPDTWEKVKTTMNDVQHDDTIEVVKKRTS